MKEGLVPLLLILFVIPVVGIIAFVMGSNYLQDQLDRVDTGQRERDNAVAAGEGPGG